MLLLAGHDFEVLDRWTWAQVQLAQECVMAAVSQGLELVLSPLAMLSGHNYSPGKVQHGARRPVKPTVVNRDDPAARARAEQRDTALMRGAGAAGISIDL